MKNRTFSPSKTSRLRPRRRGTSRLFVLSAAVVASTAVGGKVIHAQHASRNERPSNTPASSVTAASSTPAVTMNFAAAV